MPRGRPIGGNATIKDMLKRPPPSSQQLTSNSEDEDLRIALQLSKQEHVNEQKRIFEQLARLSRHSSQTEDKSGFRLKKRRIIRRDSDEDEDEDNDIMVKTAKDTEDEDQWFQTVSSRPQPRRRISLSKNKSKERTKKIVEKKPIKKEPEKNQVLLDIDDVSELITKEEEKEESYDLTSLLMDESDTNITEDRNDAEAPKDEQSDSDCSVIDLVETPWTEDIPQAEEEKEDDDGYLSPLEGFTSLKDVGDDASYNNYYNQFRSSAASTPSATRPKTTRRKKTTSTSTPKKKKFYRKFWAKKRKQ